MGNYSHLIVDFESFKEPVLNFIAQGNELAKQQVNSNEDLLDFTEKAKQWKSDVGDLLMNSFAVQKNSFYYEFISAGMRRNFDIQNNYTDLYQESKNLKDTLSYKVEYLEHNLRIISECDSILAREIDLPIRAKYSTQEKLNFILEKLYRLNDGNYYPVELLLRTNGVQLNSTNEIWEMVNILEDNDYVNNLGGLGADISARITVSGSLYWEQINRPYTEDYSDISDNQSDINSRVDEIIESLKTLGLGQEILFEELQELKELYGKLNKKNWSQIVKGKLLDLALGKLVENDTVKYIYEKLTGHDLRLP